MQFKLNDMVMHCREGLATISSTTKMGEREYFIVHSVHGDGEAIYVPFATAENIIRPVMTKDEAESLINKIKLIKKEFNSNTKQRRDAFRKRLNSGDIKDIAYLFAQNILYTKEPEDVKLGAADIEMLEFAQNFLLDELSLSYRISREEILDFVINKLK